jgi:hypothetical protein
MTDAAVYEALAPLTYRGPLDAPYGLEGRTLPSESECLDACEAAGISFL